MLYNIWSKYNNPFWQLHCIHKCTCIHVQCTCQLNNIEFSPEETGVDLISERLGFCTDPLTTTGRLNWNCLVIEDVGVVCGSGLSTTAIGEVKENILDEGTAVDAGWVCGVIGVWLAVNWKAVGVVDKLVWIEKI